MADDEHKASEAAPRAGHARRRPAPTIDLKATEVAGDAPPAQPEPTPTPTPTPESSAADGAASPDTPAHDAGSPSPPGDSPRRVSLLVGAALLGGVSGLALALAVWAFLPPRSEVSQQAARIATLDSQVREFAAREAKPAANSALVERVAAVEKNLAVSTEALTALKRRSDANAAAAEAAQHRADAAAAKADTAQSASAPGADRQDIAELNTRLTALERTAQALQSDIARQRSNVANLAKQRSTRADERAVRLAVVAETLKATVARGERFRAELDAAKALAADPTVLAPLETFADTGVPTAATLAQRLHVLLPAMRRAVQPKSANDGGFLQRLQVNAERLVRIRPVGEQSGDDAGAILTRIDAKAGRSDITGALTELAALPPTVRAPADGWIKAARAREAAVDASRRFAAAQIGALAGPAE